jgi:hypothetical protein
MLEINNFYYINIMYLSFILSFNLFTYSKLTKHYLNQNRLEEQTINNSDFRVREKSLENLTEKYYSNI